MNCVDIRKLLPDLALGDLDAEPAAEVAVHLKSCPGCRAEEASLGRAVSLMRTARPISPSTERRSTAVAAMLRARAGQPVRSARSWTPWATAAAFLLALVAALSGRVGGTAFKVAQVSGRVELLEPGSDVSRTLAVGDVVSVGDRVVTEVGGVVVLNADAAELWLDQDSSLNVVQARRVTLDRGRMLARVGGGSVAPLVVTDMANHSAVVTGQVELSLREVTGLLAGSRENKNEKPILPAPRTEVRRHLVARVGEGEARLNGSEGQRLHAAAGQEGTFTFGGQPATAVLDDAASLGAWTAPGYYDRKK